MSSVSPKVSPCAKLRSNIAFLDLKPFGLPLVGLVLAVSGYLFAQNWWGNWFFLAIYSGGAVVIVGSWLYWRCVDSPLNLLPAAFLLLYYTHIPDKLAALLTFMKTTATYDAFLLYVDRSFGFSPSILVSRWVSSVHLLQIFFWIYLALSIAIGACFAAHIRQEEPPWRIVVVLFAAVVIGALCYNLLPACGPRMLLGGNDFYSGDAFAAFPGTQPAMVAVTPKYPRNAMPSLHMTWALLVLWISRDLGRGHWLAAIFAFFTAVATLSIGEHYLVDLVVAFPFALAIWNLCIGDVPLSHPKRTLTVAGGACVYLAWTAAIRFSPTIFYASPVIPWLASAATVAGTLFIVYSQPAIPFANREATSS